MNQRYLLLLLLLSAPIPSHADARRIPVEAISDVKCVPHGPEGNPYGYTLIGSINGVSVPLGYDNLNKDACEIAKGQVTKAMAEAPPNGRILFDNPAPAGKFVASVAPTVPPGLESLDRKTCKATPSSTGEVSRRLAISDCHKPLELATISCESPVGAVTATVLCPAQENGSFVVSDCLKFSIDATTQFSDGEKAMAHPKGTK